MLVWKRWMVFRDGCEFFPNKDNLCHKAEFEGLFLFGIIPLWIRQKEVWD